MLVARGRLENFQALIQIGVQRFNGEISGVTPIQTVPQMPIASYWALLDTGAQRSCLTHKAIAAESLARHGKRFIKNVHNENVHSLFMVRFGFWGADDGNQMGSQESHKSYYGLPDPVEVINIADNERFDAIIGMDVLSRFDVIFERSGGFHVKLV